MSRPIRTIKVITLALLLLIAVCIGVAWTLLASQAGLQFVAQQLKARAGDTVQWSHLEGSLSSALQVDDLLLSLPGLHLSAGTLYLSWQPGALLHGTASLNALRGSDIQLTLSPTESEPDSAPFSPESIQLPVNLELSEISFTDLQIIQDGQAPVQIDSLALSARLEKQQLTLRRLALRVPQGGVSLTGQTTLATHMPLNTTLTWDWLLTLPADPADATSGADRTARINGELALNGDIAWRDQIEFSLQYQLAADGIQAFNSDLPAQLAANGELRGAHREDTLALKRLSLILPDSALSLSMTGEIAALGTEEPEAAIVLGWTGLRWPLQSQTADIASEKGELQFTGTASQYQLALRAGLSGHELPPSDWNISSRGDLSGLTIDQMLGKVLGGELGITGELQWEPRPRWDLHVDAAELDPGQWLPDLPGLLTLALSSKGEIDPDAGPQADVALHEVSGQLLGYPLQGETRLKLSGESLRIDSLSLDSAGNVLSASGEVSADTLAIDWQLEANNPTSLAANASGELSAGGKVAGSVAEPRIQIRVSGNQLAWDSYSLPTLTLGLTAGLTPNDPFQLDLHTDQVQSEGSVLLDSMQLQVNGTMAKHHARGVLETVDQQLAVEFDGGLNDQLDGWQGQFSRMSLETGGYGLWQLASPAQLSLAADRAALSQSCLRADSGSGSLCIEGNWQTDGDSAIQSRLRALPLELFVPGVTGPVDGDLNATLAANGALQVAGKMTLGAGDVTIEDNRKLSHGGAKLDLQVNEQGLLANLDLAAPEKGKLQAQAKLSALTSLPVAEEQPLVGFVRAALPDLSGLAAWVPEVGSSAGRLTADATLGGTLSNPLVEGTLALEQGAVTLPVAGLELRDIGLRVISDPAQPDLLAVSGGVRSGPGQLNLSGLIDVAQSGFEFNLSGERFQVFDTPDAQALLSPELKIAWREDTLNLRGQVAIPEAAITPKIQLSPAALGQGNAQEEIPGQVIAPSADVVVVSETLEYQTEAQIPDAPFRIDSRVRLVMGDDVRVSAVGFVSQITGAVDFINAPERKDLIPVANGRFSLRDGTFRAFGQDLEIETGHLIFANVPATEPELNLRAVRWIDNDPQVTAAGVLVTGRLTQPSLELFSRPQLETSEIQSYLLTGSSPRSRNNVLGIGTYVSPRIYVGYGYNMLEKTSEFNSLFNISPRYGVGSSVGEADNNINLTITYER